MTTIYNHAFDIAFSIDTDKENAEDVTPLELMQAIINRAIQAYNDEELHEACGMAFDSYDQTMEELIERKKRYIEADIKRNFNKKT